MATNLRSYLNPIIPERDPEGSSNDRSHRNKWTSAKDQHACRGSRWSESEATCRFRAQSKQFDTGTSSTRGGNDKNTKNIFLPFGVFITWDP